MEKHSFKEYEKVFSEKIYFTGYAMGKKIREDGHADLFGIKDEYEARMKRSLKEITFNYLDKFKIEVDRERFFEDITLKNYMAGFKMGLEND